MVRARKRPVAPPAPDDGLDDRREPPHRRPRPPLPHARAHPQRAGHQSPRAHVPGQLFDVPITYFFIPPPEMGDATLADSGRPVTELYRSLLGTDAQLDVIDERLSSIGVEDPDDASEVLTSFFGADGAAGN